MSNLLVVSAYLDERRLSADYPFVAHLVKGLTPYFEKIHVVAPTPYVPRFLAPLARSWETLRHRMSKYDYAYDNVEVHFAPFAPWAGRLPGRDRTRAVLPAVLRTIRKHDLHFDLVHAHNCQNFGWHGLQVARTYGVPSLLTVHDNHDSLMEALRGQRWDVLEALRQTDRLIRVTPTDVDAIRELSGTERPIDYIANGFDADALPNASQAELRERHGLPSNRRVFVSVGRWDARKDPLTLLEGLARMRVPAGARRPLLCVIGQDTMGGQIQQRIADLSLEDDVRLVGVTTPEVVLEYMGAGDAVVLYSVSEANPTVLFEALGSGRPFIGSDVGGVSAVLVDERLGLFGPARDADALARLLERAAATSWDETFIRAHAERYSWAHIARRTYDEVMTPLLS